MPLAIPRVIWKWEIPGPGSFTLLMPKGALTISVSGLPDGGDDDPIGELWAILDTPEDGRIEERDAEERRFYAVATGQSFAHSETFALSFIGTIRSRNATVWHILAGVPIPAARPQ